MEHQEESIIFCQAPLKIAAVLNCYKQEIAKGRKVAIVVMNARNMYSFIQELKLDVKLFFFERPNNKGHRIILFRNIKKKAKDNINLLKKSGYTLSKKTNIFFTDICDNWEIGLYLKLFENCNIIKIQDKLDIVKNLDSKENNRKNISLKMKIEEIIYLFLYGYPWVYTLIDHWTMKIDLSKLNYPLLDLSDMSICNDYMFSAPQYSEKSVLFFTEPYRNRFQSEANYEDLNIFIVNSLHKLGYKVGIKGHPRIGCNENALKLADFEIPSYVPAEFLNLKCYDFVIGFVSSSLCSASKQVKAYSILPMCEVQNQKELDYWYDYLNKLSDGRVIFIENINKVIHNVEY